MNCRTFSQNPRRRGKSHYHHHVHLSLFILALTGCSYCYHCVFFICASICQCVVVYPEMVAVTHTRTSVRHCLHVEQWQAIRSEPVWPSGKARGW